jgi:hypothetical protein
MMEKTILGVIIVHITMLTRNYEVKIHANVDDVDICFILWM